MDGLTFTLFGFGGAALVTILMQVVKAVLPVVKDQIAVLVAVGLGIVLSVIAHFINSMDPTLEAWAVTILAGIIEGFTAGGMYSLVKNRAADTT